MTPLTPARWCTSWTGKEEFRKPSKTSGDQSVSVHDLLVGEACDLLKFADKGKLVLLNEEANQYQHLDNFLSEMYELLSGIQNAISKTYFKHAQSQKQLFATDKPGETAGE
ncbi:MAG: hypothetical protein WKI04_04105 [Ferruginibacter sp.]